ncbi:unnamed protein product, partial [Tetraodon nigroviridis]
VDPREILKEVESLLGKDGALCSLEGVTKVFSLMKASAKMVSRCMYLNILLQSKSQDVLDRFITIGGYRLLNSWLTHSKSTSNAPMLQLILLTLQNLPLRVEHLKQNNTAKLVKQLSKSAENEDLRNLASELVDGWMAIIRSQSVSNSSPAGTGCLLLCSPSAAKRLLSRAGDGRPQSRPGQEDARCPTAGRQIQHQASGSEETTVGPPVPTRWARDHRGPKVPTRLTGIFLLLLSSGPLENTPFEKKYKPLNTPSNSAKEIKVKIIPAQRESRPAHVHTCTRAGCCWLRHSCIFVSLQPWSPPASWTPSTQPPSPASRSRRRSLEPPATPRQPRPPPPRGVPSTASPRPILHLLLNTRLQKLLRLRLLRRSTTRWSSLGPRSPQKIWRLLTWVASPESVHACRSRGMTSSCCLIDLAEKTNSLSEPREEENLTKKGKKKKTVHWPEEDQLKNYFYFDLDETERVNVNKIKDFGEAAKRELMMDRQTFEMARRLSHDTMEERVPWNPPKPLSLAGSLVTPGVNSTERLTQREREMGILQEIFLSKESVPDSPHEPEPEPYEPVPPRLIPLDEDSSSLGDPYPEQMEATPPQGAAMAQAEGSKLPPVLAKLMDNLSGSGSSFRGPQAANAAAPVNVQELLSSIMVSLHLPPLGQQGFSGGTHSTCLTRGLRQPVHRRVDPAAGLLRPDQAAAGLSTAEPEPDPEPDPEPEPGGSRRPPLQPPPSPSQQRPSLQRRRRTAHDGAAAGPGPRGQRQLLGGRVHAGRTPSGRSFSPRRTRARSRAGLQGPRSGRAPRRPQQHERCVGVAGALGPTGPDRFLLKSEFICARTGSVLAGLDMSKRPLCRHFMMKGSCSPTENNCAFYHPGVNGPPLPPNHPANKQHSQHGL